MAGPRPFLWRAMRPLPDSGSIRTNVSELFASMPLIRFSGSSRFGNVTRLEIAFSAAWTAKYPPDRYSVNREQIRERLHLPQTRIRHQNGALCPNSSRHPSKRFSAARTHCAGRGLRLGLDHPCLARRRRRFFIWAGSPVKMKIVFLFQPCYNRSDFTEKAGIRVMEDTKKQSDQELIPPPGETTGFPAKEPDLHLIDFWELLSELRI